MKSIKQNSFPFSVAIAIALTLWLPGSFGDTSDILATTGTSNTSTVTTTITHGVGVGDTAGSDADSDGDGMPDWWEIANGTNPNVDDANEDPDCDGLTNIEEFHAGTLPFNPYTDEDDLMDGEDGWPLEPALSPPRLPDTSYAIIELDKIGFNETYTLLQINDLGQVLATYTGDDIGYDTVNTDENGAPFEYYFEYTQTVLWNPGDQSLTPVPILSYIYSDAFLSDLNRNGANYWWMNDPEITCKPRLLNNNGTVCGTINNVSGSWAAWTAGSEETWAPATWTKENGTSPLAHYSAGLPQNVEDMTYSETGMAINDSGVVVGVGTAHGYTYTTSNSTGKRDIDVGYCGWGGIKWGAPDGLGDYGWYTPFHASPP